MRELTFEEARSVSGGADIAPPNIEPLVQNPQTVFGGVLNEAHEAYIRFLNTSIFPYIYYCL